MIRTAFGLLALLALLPALQGRDKPHTPTPAQLYQTLVQDFEKAQEEAIKAFREEAKKAKGKAKAINMRQNPQLDKFAPLFLKLAETYPKDPVAVDALVWVVVRGNGEPRSKAMTFLLRDHIQSEQMATVCSTLALTFQDKDIQKLLRAVLEKSKHRPSQAQACLALARGAENRQRLAQRFKERPEMAKNYESILGKQAVEAIVEAGPEKLGKEVEALYEQVVKDFADATDSEGNKLSELAKDKLEALRNPIVVGKPAPEIEGEDIDGVKFKLSDYRGKVVLLDFWGNW
jgi:hypothetical protein